MKEIRLEETKDYIREKTSNATVSNRSNRIIGTINKETKMSVLLF